MNRGEIRQAVRDDLDEATAAFWSDALLNRYIDRSVKLVETKISQLGEGLFERTYEGTYPASTRQVSLVTFGLPMEPLAFIGVWDITDDALHGVPLDHIRLADDFYYYSRDGSLADITSLSDSAYYLSAGIGGDRQIGYRPIPGSNRTLRIVAKAQTGNLLDDNDTPACPEAFHEAIVLASVIRAKLREEAPIADVKDEFQRVMQNAVLTLEGRHEDVDNRVFVTDPEFYQYA